MSEIREDSKHPATKPDKLVIPAIQVIPGSISCLHIPHGFDREKELESKLLQIADQHRMKAVICKPAGSKPDEDLKIRLTRTWLAQTASISEKEAGEIIADLPITIDIELNCNAGTPRAILGIAAGLTGSPDVIVYDTTALDYQGVRDVNQFVTDRCRGKAVVHLSYEHLDGYGNPKRRVCPKGAACFEIE